MADPERGPEGMTMADPTEPAQPTDPAPSPEPAAPVTKPAARKPAAAKTPAVKTPAAKAPAAKTPAAKAPAVKTPAAKTPAAKTPATKPAAARTTPAKKDVAGTPTAVLGQPVTAAPAAAAPAAAAPAAAATSTTPAAPTGAPTDTTPPPSGAPTDTTPPPPPPPAGTPVDTTPPPPPAAPGSRKKLFLILGAVAVVIVLAIIAIVVVFSVQAANHAPDRVVSAYLDDLVDGDAEDALERLSPAPDGNLALLTDDVYDETPDRITAYDITSTSSSGGDAVVEATITTPAGDTTETFLLHSTGKDFIWDVWALDGASLPTITVDFLAPEGLALSVNGEELEGLGGITGPLLAFPGTYTFEAAGETDFVTTESQSATVSTLSATGAEPQLTFETVLTAEGETAARAAVDRFLDACIAQHVFAPTGNCGFEITGATGSYTTINWSIGTRPVASFGPYAVLGFPVETDTPGVFNLSASGPSGSGTGTIRSYSYYGTVIVDSDGTASFVSLYDD